MNARHLVCLLLLSSILNPVVARAGFFDEINPLTHVKRALNPKKTVDDAIKLHQDTGKTIEKAAHDVGKALEKAAGDTGKAIEKAAHDTGNAAEKALHDTGRALEDTGQFIADHPWETVAVVAFAVGGAYLIVYQGYALSLTVGGETVATFTAAELGVGTAAAGVAASTALSNKSTSDKTQAPVQTKATSKAPAAGEKNDQARVMNGREPILPKSPTVTDKLIYAYEALQWHSDNPVGKLKPDDPFTPVELKLVEVMVELGSVPDSPADVAAREQAKEREYYLDNLLKDIVVELLKGKVPDPMEKAMDALKESATPTTIGDGQRAAREVLAREVSRALGEYADERDPCFNFKKPSSKPNCNLERLRQRPEGPTIHAQPLN